MIKKILIVTLILVFLISSSYAISSSTYSLRAKGGQEYIYGEENYTSLKHAQISFSARYSQVKEDGSASLSVSAKTTNGERVTLKLKLIDPQILEYSGDHIVVQSKGEGRYYFDRNRGKIIIDSVIYEFDNINKTMNIYSLGNISPPYIMPISIINIPSTILVHKRY